MRRFRFLAIVLVLAACAAPPAIPVIQPPPPAPPAPRLPSPPPLAIPPPRPQADQCGAGALQALVGRPETQIPVPLTPGARRVICTTCPMTREYIPGRLTILFDPVSGLVTSVACG
ncbi:MAG: peptidase inhibitor I78 [Caulobacteraceae bacterium]